MVLLPLASWAVDVTVTDGVTVTIDKQYVATGSMSPVVSEVAISGVAGSPFTGAALTSAGVVDKDFNKAVEPLTTVGYYYKVVVVSTAEGKYSRVFVPFYVGERFTPEYINSALAFGNSVAGSDEITSGALKLYYDHYIGYYSEGGEGANVSNAADLKAGYEAEKSSWTEAASRTKDGRKDKYDRNEGFPWFAFKAPATGSFKPVFSYTGTVTNSGNNDYVNKTDVNGQFFATPWGENGKFGPNDKKWGVASVHALYGTGQVYYDEETSSDKGVDTFEPGKFTAYWIPATFDATVLGAAKIENYSRIVLLAIPFTVPYGTKFEDPNDPNFAFTVTPDMIQIDNNGGSSLNSATASKLTDLGIFKFSKVTTGDWTAVNQTTGYTYKLTWDKTPYVEDGVNYEISFNEDQSRVYIAPAINTFMDGEEYQPTVKAEVTYAGEPQSLLDNAGAATFPIHKTSTNGVEYAVIPVPAATTGETITAVPSLADFTEGTDYSWANDALAENVGQYWVFARPSADKNGNSWVAGEAKFIETSEIVKAKPYLEIAGLADKYYKKTGATTTNGLSVALPTAPARLYINIVNGTQTTKKYLDNTTEKTYYDAAAVTYTVWKVNQGSSSTNEGALGSWVCGIAAADITAEGQQYKIVPAFAGNDNLESGTRVPDSEFFTVYRPTVTITVADVSVPFATKPNFSLQKPYAWTGYEGKVVEPIENPQWIVKNLDGTPAYPNEWQNNYAAGQYTVEINPASITVKNEDEDGAATGDHIVTVVPGKFTVGAADIYAQIEDANLIYGQVLPLKMTHKNGVTGEAAQQAFNNSTNWTLTATKWDTTNDKAELDENGDEIVVPLDDPYDLLPVGTWTITAKNQTYRTAPNSNNYFNVVATHGTWTVVPKNLDDDVDGEAAGYTIDFSKFKVNNANPKYVYAGVAIIPEDRLSTDESNAVIGTAGRQVTSGWGWGQTTTSYNFPLLASSPLVPAVVDNPATAENETQDEIPAVQRDYTYAVTGDNVNARNNIEITLTGEGNFCGTKTLAYDITKKEITVKPAAGTWQVGDDEDDYSIDWADLWTKLVPADQEAYPVDLTADPQVNVLQRVSGFSSLAVRRVTGPNVGSFADGLEAYLPENAAQPVNYQLNPGNGKIDITPGILALKVKAVSAEYNGTDKPDVPFDFEVDPEGSVLSDVYYDGDNWKSLIVLAPDTKLDWQISGEKTNDRYVVDGNYKVKLAETEASKISPTNFNVTITGTEAALTITPAPLTITTKNQGSYEFDKLDKSFQDGIDQVENFSAQLKNGDAMTDIVKGVKIPEDVTIHYGKNEAVIDTAMATPTLANNYDITVEKGDLDIAMAAELVLTSDMEDEMETVEGKEKVKNYGDQSKITQYDGLATSKVTLKLKEATLIKGELVNPKFSAWKAGEWHGMVLPFNVRVRDISKNFGYAIVNVVDPTKTDKDNVGFTLKKITEEIPANTPFCVKSDEDFDYDKTLEFESDAAKDFVITVVKPEAWTVVEEFDNSYGYTFEGSYLEKEDMKIDNTKSYLRFLGPTTDGSKWYYIKSTAESKYFLPPYTSYVNLGEGNEYNTREVIFTFEEADGSTTAIKGVDFMNGNKANAEGLYRVDGIKLQSAPTQKGVYVQDGKKFVK